MFGYHRKPGTSTGEALRKLPKLKREIPMTNYIKEPTYDPPVIRITGVSKDEAEDLKKILSRLEIGGLTGRKYEVLPRTNTLTYIYTDGVESESTYTEDTIQEINEKLNSDKEFITIGNIVIKRKLVMEVIKTDKEFNQSES
ncbi:MAG: hypothetical protein ACLSTJ_05805 [Clostridium neonatale]